MLPSSTLVETTIKSSTETHLYQWKFINNRMASKCLSKRKGNSCNRWTKIILRFCLSIIMVIWNTRSQIRKMNKLLWFCVSMPTTSAYLIFCWSTNTFQRVMHGISSLKCLMAPAFCIMVGLHTEISSPRIACLTATIIWSWLTLDSLPRAITINRMGYTKKRIVVPFNSWLQRLQKKMIILTREDQ